MPNRKVQKNTDFRFSSVNNNASFFVVGVLGCDFAAFAVSGWDFDAFDVLGHDFNEFDVLGWYFL